MTLSSIKKHSFIKTPYFEQKTDFNCWPACTKMLLDFWEDWRSFSQKQLSDELKTTSQDWTENQRIVNFFISAWYYIFNTKNSTCKDLIYFIEKWIPIIINYKDIIWDYWHYGVVVWCTQASFILNDPYRWELFKISKKTLLKQWSSWDDNIKWWMLAVIKEKYFPYYMLWKYQKEFVWKMI